MLEAVLWENPTYGILGGRLETWLKAELSAHPATERAGLEILRLRVRAPAPAPTCHGRSEVQPSQPQVQDQVRNSALARVRHALRSRGDVTIWLSAEAIAALTPPKNGLHGGQRRYSNLAILTALRLRLVFRLPLRQTEGFLDSLLSWMGLDLKAPDHTTLSRRNQFVEVQPLTRAHDGPIDLIVDSTGLKILGSGEWKVHKHKASERGRAWRKLHIGVDEEGFIVAAALTPGSVDDGPASGPTRAQMQSCNNALRHFHSPS